MLSAEDKTNVLGQGAPVGQPPWRAIVAQSFGKIRISDSWCYSDKRTMSEEVLIVGKRGEIFTSKGLRTKAKIREGGRVKASVVDGSLVIEPIPTIEDLLRTPVFTMKASKAERLSEEAQKAEGVYE